MSSSELNGRQRGGFLAAFLILFYVAIMIMPLVLFVPILVRHVIVPTVSDLILKQQDLPVAAEDLDICENVAYPAASAYEGPPPHPIHAPFIPDLDRNDSLFSDAWQPEQASDVQLAGCVKQVGEERPVLEWCSYLLRHSSTPIDIPIYPAIYELSLYEIRTNRQIDTPIKLLGEHGECPNSMMLNLQDTQSRKIYTRLSSKQYSEAWGKYVDGDQ